MPKITALAPSDLDYDLAQLGDPLTDDALDTLSTVIEIRDTIAEMAAHINHMQTMLEAGAPAYRTREQFAVDLDELAARIRTHIDSVIG